MVCLIDIDAWFAGNVVTTILVSAKFCSTRLACCDSKRIEHDEAKR